MTPTQDIVASPNDVLKKVFGYDAFRGNQQVVIDSVMAGESCCVLMPTGAGKSLCYQVPALCRRGVGIVVSPLIALMQDQIATLRELGVRATSINSALSYDEVQAAYRDLRAGELDLLYVAPERLVRPEFVGLLEELNQRGLIALLAIDEAHCISQWGHDFRPEYRELTNVRAKLEGVPCLAVTATADEPTRKDIQERLNLPRLISSGFDRPNITYTVGIKHNPKQQLRRFLKERPAGESGIIYCLSRKKVEETAAWLVEEGFDALPYHAGFDNSVREANQDRFIKEEGLIMVATVAFGMGIDKPNVRFVAHLDLPKNIEAYYQETGRAGRDGLPSEAWMIYGMQDVVLLNQMIDRSEAPENQKQIERQKLRSFLAYCETATCRRSVLLRYFGDECEPCGNCDTCLNPPKTMDGTIAAQKLLSCILRTGQSFGANYVIDVLLGNANERIISRGHDQLSTFDIGGEFTKIQWNAITRQLLAAGLIFADHDAHGALKMTAMGMAFLKERQTIELKVDQLANSAKIERGAKAPAKAQIEDIADQELFEKLRARRMELARERNVPPYVIFNDKTLIEMAVERPQRLEEMLEISGVGESKLERFGPAFLEIIRD
ncbi:ATP-dependent DNA helicase RecQ [Pseudovibrio denitrificans]|uniref:DNA helicase RecQ n=1 Tax=Pseudovibrio denitrificans TaxID=258256 RepID=A0A1I7AGU5_9HYPH|nr:DNA helicase RecQ [Pseudovibrio denitrificans]SFT74169.1 ATP-dependent DNA helicase RecQ [Pseudovibrio denitrificans]